ncbi:ABC transporter permease [Streptomyces oryzae]|uniref:ABC transporter permease n=1 Tax=Streptomyces oryzae TaxID=1434886 RepID=A0ABS3X4I2_9ACTN|nr:ABC transporter permease [Streptomyces oryzae]MBO8190286.1 ABC transporter permease [Streptomyces oryzae]
MTLTADPGVAESRLAARAQAALPDGLRAVTRQALDAEATATAGNDQRKLTSVLLSFAGIALFVATFLVANAFAMLSAARAGEHALLRAIGATRRHVLRLVLTEAVLVGTVAAVLGHLLGMGGWRPCRPGCSVPPTGQVSHCASSRRSPRSPPSA